MNMLLLVIANVIMAIEIIKLNNEVAYLEYRINTYELLKKEKKNGI